jgi:hypothetical protein
MANDKISSASTNPLENTPTSLDLLDRLTKTAPLWLGLLVLLKTVGVAEFSLITASALITAAPIPVLLGSLVLYEPIFMAALAMLCIWLIFKLKTQGNRSMVPLLSAIALLAILLTPLHILYISILAAAITLFTRYIRPSWFRRASHEDGDSRSGSGDSDSRSEPEDSDSRSRPEVLSRFRFGASIVALLIGAFIIFTIDIPWVPPEVVTLMHPISVGPNTTARKPVVYIISEQDGEVSMLIDDTRAFVTVASSDVESRTVCFMTRGVRFSSLPLVWVIFERHSPAPNLACWLLTDDPKEETYRSYINI